RRARLRLCLGCADNALADTFFDVSELVQFLRELGYVTRLSAGVEGIDRWPQLRQHRGECGGVDAGTDDSDDDPGYGRIVGCQLRAVGGRLHLIAPELFYSLVSADAQGRAGGKHSNSSPATSQQSSGNSNYTQDDLRDSFRPMDVADVVADDHVED